MIVVRVFTPDGANERPCRHEPLIASGQGAHPQHESAREALRSLSRANHVPVVVPQVIYEFWVVATRPIDDNGLGLDVDQARAQVEALLNLYPLYHDDGLLFTTWRDLVGKYGVRGKLAHDARLAAAVVRHRLTHLLTFNAKDFARFMEVNVLTPSAAVALSQGQ